MAQPLKCPGVGRDKDCVSALQFYFSRRVTDDEMRFLHEVVQRAVACGQKDEECGQCRGTGRHLGAFGGPDWPRCGSCGGTGRISR